MDHSTRRFELAKGHYAADGSDVVPKSVLDSTLLFGGSLFDSNRTTIGSITKAGGTGIDTDVDIRMKFVQRLFPTVYRTFQW